MRTSHVVTILVSLAAFAVPRLAHATNVPGGTVINQTWTVAGSPYVVAGDITVPAGAFLEIEAGVEVQLAATDSQGSGVTTKVELFVDGSLRALGTTANPVTLRGSSAVGGSWQGIVVRAGAEEVALAHVVIQHAVVGIRAGATGADVYATDEVWVDGPTQNGLYAAAGTPTIDGLTVSGAGSYGIFVDDSSPTLTRCVVRSGGSYGIYSDPAAGYTLTIRNCTIHGNTYTGLYATGGASTVSLTNSIITSNGDYGFYRGGSATATHDHNDIWNNTDGNYVGATAPATSLSTNPLYVSATDMRLTSNSPARFGTAMSADLGARPYDGVATPGWYGVLWTDTALSAADGPYDVAGDLVVGPGVTVEIEAGTTLTFAANSDIMGSGLNSARGELILRGTIVAEGTAADPITLQAASGGSGSWYGVVVEQGTTGGTWDHVRLLAPIVGINYRDGNDGLEIDHTEVVSPSQNGLYAFAGNPVLDGFEVSGSGSYGMFLGDASPTLRNCVVRSGGSYGIYSDPAAGYTLTISNSVMNANTYSGLYLTGGASTATLTNSIIASNGDYGVYRGGSSTLTQSYNDVWNNTDGNYVGATAPGTSISSNPNFVSATDLRLQSSSVCIDAGTAGLTHDAVGVVRPLDGNGIGGSQVDLGAYEFVLVPACGNGSLEAGETCDDGAANGLPAHCEADCSGVAPFCGDGDPSGDEECDDGNAIDTDGCLATCVVASCGDGEVEDGVEACDDGNGDDTDACTTACEAATCGDGAVQDGVEACDDGNADDTDACLATCVVASCGDGEVQAGVEGCDDGNADDTDACGTDCVSTSCGDGVLDPTVEECDDGNDVETDACRGACIEARCGDGILFADAEDCEDGNAEDGDGCSAVCEFEDDGGGGSPGASDGGCCQTGSRGDGALALVTLVGLALVRRRRR